MHHSPPNPTTPRRKSFSDKPALVLEPASLSIRLLALVMDSVLILLLTSFALSRVFMPTVDRDGYVQLQKEWQQYSWVAEAAAAEGEEKPPLELSDRSEVLLLQAAGAGVGLVWLLFLVGELFCRGSSIGKKIFRLRVVRSADFKRLRLHEVLLRTTLKTAILFLLLSIILKFTPLVAILLLILLALLPMLNSYRLFLHDYLCRTVVVQTCQMEE